MTLFIIFLFFVNIFIYCHDKAHTIGLNNNLNILNNLNKEYREALDSKDWDLARQKTLAWLLFLNR